MTEHVIADHLARLRANLALRQEQASRDPSGPDVINVGPVS